LTCRKIAVWWLIVFVFVFVFPPEQAGRQARNFPSESQLRSRHHTHRQFRIVRGVAPPSAPPTPAPFQPKPLNSGEGEEHARSRRATKRPAAFSATAGDRQGLLK